MKWSVIGHDTQKKLFEKTLTRETLVHAYLFAGPAMIGKRSFALDLIRASHEGAEPGENDPYTTIIAPDGRHPIPIGDIRAMRRSLALRPPAGIRRFVLIDDAERMNAEAANALLKVLEEPPPSVTFLLVSAAPGQLPETVRSRCHEVRFDTIPNTLMAKYVTEQQVPDASREQLAALAVGRPGWIARVASGDRVKEVLSDSEQYRVHLDGGLAERLVWAKELAGREDIRELAEQWIAGERSALHDGTTPPERLHRLLALHETLGNVSMRERIAIEDFLLHA
jgi:DNA polymerase-3 subunit delta'